MPVELMLLVQYDAAAHSAYSVSSDRTADETSIAWCELREPHDMNKGYGLVTSGHESRWRCSNQSCDGCEIMEPVEMHSCLSLHWILQRAFSGLTVDLVPFVVILAPES